MEDKDIKLEKVNFFEKKIHIDLAKKIGYLFFDNITYEFEDQVEENLKELLENHNIINVDFLSLQELTEACCLLKSISFKDNFKNTGLYEFFNANLIFEKILASNIKPCQDIETQMLSLKSSMKGIVDRVNREYNKEYILRNTNISFSIATKPSKNEKSETLFDFSKIKMYNRKPIFCIVKVPEKFLNQCPDILKDKKASKSFINLQSSEVENFIKVLLNIEEENGK